MSKKVEVAGIMGPIGFIGWLFTIGFLKLTFFKGLLALIIWPYYIGDFLHIKNACEGLKINNISILTGNAIGRINQYKKRIFRKFFKN